jgi:hypothetical protein
MILHGDEYTFQKPDQSTGQSPTGAGYLEQFIASIVPCPRWWRPGSHSSVGNPDGSLNTAECIIVAQNAEIVPSRGESRQA